MLFEEFHEFYAEFTKSQGNVLDIVGNLTFDDDVVRFEENFNSWKDRTKKHLVAVVREQPDFSNLYTMLKKCHDLNNTSFLMDHMYPKIFKITVNRK